MGMANYPIQGVGIDVNSLSWKDPAYLEQKLDACDGFYYQLQPNGVTAYMEIATDEHDVTYLIIHNYRAYQRTPFESLENLEEFFVKVIAPHVHNTHEEIVSFIEDIDTTYYA